MSKWKAGQIVTIEGKVYRVTKSRSGFSTCNDCACIDKDWSEYPCSECVGVIPTIIPDDCVFTEIKPKS